MIAPSLQRHGGQAAIDQQHRRWFVLGKLQGFIKQGLVSNGFAAARAGIGADHHLGLGIVDARGQRDRGKAAKHHAVDGAQAHAGQHGKGRFGNHGHVNLHPVALAHAKRLQHGGHALHFFVQLGKGVNALGVGLGRYGDDGRLVRTLGQVAINGVVAQVELAIGKPAGKGRVVVVTGLLGRLVPVDGTGLFQPKCLASVWRNRLAVKIGVVAKAGGLGHCGGLHRVWFFCILGG